MTALLAAADVALYLLIAAGLALKYRRTRDAGLLWLGMPLVFFPVVALPIAWWLQAATDRLARGQPAGSWPFTLVEQGRLTLGALLTLFNLTEHLVWGAFALVAVLMLGRASADKAGRAPP